MKNLAQEQESTHTTVNEQINSNSLINRKQITKLFTLVETEQGHFLTIGNLRVTEITTKEDCIKQIEEKDWNLLLNTVNAINQITKNI